MIEGLKSSLPPEWEACNTPDEAQDLLYRNKVTKEIQLDHPVDVIYREKLLKLKKIRQIESHLGMEPIDEERDSWLK